MLVDELNIEDAVKAARYFAGSAERRGVFDRTPLIELTEQSTLLQQLRERNPAMRQAVGRLFLKMDSVQEEGSFKARGAEYFFYILDENDELPKVAVTASAGNHARGFSRAVNEHGVEGVVFLPTSAPRVKIYGVRALDVEVRLEGKFYDESVAAAKKFADETGALYVPAYEHQLIIYGQGSKALEIFQKMGGIDPISALKSMGPTDFPFPFVPDMLVEAVGGGGSITGDGIIADYMDELKSRKTYVIGVQTSASNALARSFHHQRIMPASGGGSTKADGINVRTASPGMLGCVLKYVDDIVEVDEEPLDFSVAGVHLDSQLRMLKEDIRALSAAGARFKHGDRADKLNIVEPAGAAGIAALASGAIDLDAYANKIGHQLNVVAILTGSNIDPGTLNSIVDKYR